MTKPIVFLYRSDRDNGNGVQDQITKFVYIGTVAETGENFTKLAKTEHGTIHFIEDNMEDHIDAYWGFKKAWGALPDKLRDMVHFKDWNHVIHLHHGYDETKPEEELNLEDMKKAAAFRGGSCDSETMNTGD